MKSAFRIVLLAYAIIGWTGLVQAQSNALTISGTIINHQSSETIPYATIYNSSTGTGAISTDDGNFRLTGLHLGDSILVSFIGFENHRFVITQSNPRMLIKLKPKVHLLNAFVLRADNTYLYQLLARCTSNSNTDSKIAKTYFSLESTVNGAQVEMVESYYNGTFKNGDVSKLALKQGRIALAPFDSTFFISTETSKALNMHQLFENNAHFPTSPFELTKNKMKKTYDLSLDSRYINSAGNVIYVVAYTPKISISGFFSGMVWIDSVNAQVLKVNLQIDDARNHPFLPLGNIDSLEQIDISISKTYHAINHKMSIRSMDFNYQVKYRTRQNQQVLVNTKAVLFAYDYNAEFNLPFFKFTSSNYEDYRKINATPYNFFFWENIHEFGMNDVKKSNQLFIENQSSLVNKNIFIGTDFLKNGIFEHPYVSWSNTRIALKSSSPEPSFYKSQLGSTPSDKYNLSAQIYCDINFLNDSLNVITSTVFDPFESYYYYEMDDNGAAFINMYFDLVEIYRLDFMHSIKGETKRQIVETRFYALQQNLKITLKDYLKEVQRGKNEDGMKKWNETIYKRLKIDNLEYFGLFPIVKKPK